MRGLAAVLLSIGVAFAADKTIITNSNKDTPGPGQYIVMGTKTNTINGTSYTVPCVTSTTDLALSSTNGTSTGSEKDWDFASHDLFWAAITGTSADTGCNATGSQKCVGVATYDVSSDTLTRYFHPTFFATSIVAPDVLGNNTRAVVMNKAGASDTPPGKIFSWTTSGSGTTESMTSAHATQLAWVDGSFFVASAPSFAGNTCTTAHSPELQLWDASLTTGVKQASVAMPNNTDKPEGIYVFPITVGNSGGCSWQADYANY